MSIAAPSSGQGGNHERKAWQGGTGHNIHGACLNGRSCRDRARERGECSSSASGLPDDPGCDRRRIAGRYGQCFTRGLRRTDRQSLQGHHDREHGRGGGDRHRRSRRGPAADGHPWRDTRATRVHRRRWHLHEQRAGSHREQPSVGRRVVLRRNLCLLLRRNHPEQPCHRAARLLALPAGNRHRGCRDCDSHQERDHCQRWWWGLDERGRLADDQSQHDHRERRRGHWGRQSVGRIDRE